MRLPGPERTISSCGARRADPGVGIAGRHVAEAGPQRPEASGVLIEGPPVGGAQGVLEQRVGMDREEHAPVHLEVGGTRPLHAEEGRGGRPLGLARPREPGPRRVAAGQGAGVHGLGTRDEDDVEVAPADGPARIVHEGLGGIAPDGRDHQLCRPVALAEAEALGHEQGRIDRMPPQWRDDPDAVRTPDQGVPGGGAGAGRHAVAVLGCGPQRRRHELERFGPFGGSQAGVGRRHDLADAHDDGGARVEGHGPGSVPVHAPGLPWPAGRLDVSCASPSARITPGSTSRRS